MSAGRPFSLWLRDDRRAQLAKIAGKRKGKVGIAELINEALEEKYGSPPPVKPQRTSPPAD